MSQVQVERDDLRRLMRDFNSVASRLINTDAHDAGTNLHRFIDFIHGSEVINGFVQQKVEAIDKRNIELRREDYHRGWNIPTDSDGEIACVYILLMASYQGEQGHTYLTISSHYDLSTGNFQANVRAFNKRVVQPFVNHISTYLNDLLLDAGEHDDKARFQVLNNGTWIAGNAQGNNIVSGSGSIADSTATYTDARVLTEGIQGLRGFMDDVPEADRPEVEEAIDVLSRSAAGEDIPRRVLAEKVEVVSTRSARMKEFLKDLGMRAAGALAGHGLIQAVQYIIPG